MDATSHTASDVVRVSVVDDHPLIAAGLRSAALEHPGCEIVGEVADGSDVFRSVELDRPDVVIMDIRLGHSGDGIALARQLRARYPELKILMLSAYDLYPYVRDLYRIGVHGYVMKSRAVSSVLDVARSVAQGGLIFDPGVIARLNSGAGESGLTDSEVEVLQMLADGFTTVEIAERLSISARGVERIATNIYGKLGVRSRTEAVARAARLGLITLGE